MSHYQNILPKQGTSPMVTSASSHTSPIGLLRNETTSSGGSVSDLDHVHAGTPKRVSTACSACKTRKSKCDGRQPCERCTRHKTECIIDEDEDLRRRRAVKRKLEDLEADRRLLNHLITVLRDGSDDSIRLLLDVVRRTGSLDDLRVHLASETLPSIEPTDKRSTSRVNEDEHPRPSDPIDEPPSRRRALAIGNLLNTSPDGSCTPTQTYPHR